MSDDDVEISSSGLRFSYLRFLADGAAGLFVVLLLMAAYYLEWPIPGHGTLRSIVNGRIGYEVKIFLMVLLVVLAVPFGLMVNGFGWFLFGWVQTHVAGFWLNSRILTASTSRLWYQRVLKSEFSLEPNNLYQKAQFYEDLMLSFDPARAVSLYPVAGLKRLLRSSAVICVLCAVYSSLVARYGWMLVGLVAALFSLFGLSLLEFYHGLGILFRAYMAALRECVDGVSEREQAILECLLREKEKARDRQFLERTNDR